MATLTQSRLFKTNIDVSEPVRVQMIELLNSCLADMADLQTHAKHALRNVKGAQFQSLHELFGEIACHLEQQADDVAERITALGGVAQGTARQVAAGSTLPQYDLDAVTGEEHLRALAKRLVGGRIRTSVAVAHQLGDDATGDLPTEIVRRADKDLWFLEAHVQARGEPMTTFPPISLVLGVTTERQARPREHSSAAYCPCAMADVAEVEGREYGLDSTLAETFPCSDPLTSPTRIRPLIRGTAGPCSYAGATKHQPYLEGLW